MPEAVCMTDNASSHTAGDAESKLPNQPRRTEEYLAYFVQGVLAISPSVFKVVMSREGSIDVSGDGTVLWRLLPEKENNMQINTHQKNMNYNMLGLRLGRLALGSVLCSKFNKTQCAPAELAAAITVGIDLGTSAHLGRSESGRRSSHTHTTHTYTHHTQPQTHTPTPFVLQARAVQMQPPLRDSWMPALPRHTPGISQVQEEAAAVQNAVPEVQLEEPLLIPPALN